jgi:hypothetical protein
MKGKLDPIFTSKLAEYPSCEFGLYMEMSDSMSHESILKLYGDPSFRQIVEENGFILFKGLGIEDAFHLLSHKEVARDGLYRSLTWHVDRKNVLFLYYPLKSHRPCDFIIAKKTDAIQSMRNSLAILRDLNYGVYSKYSTLLDSVDVGNPLDVSVAIAEMSCLNAHEDYQEITEVILADQLKALKKKCMRLPISSDECQIIFCADTVDGVFCHGRILSDKAEEIVDDKVPYYFLEGGAVAVYS